MKYRPVLEPKENFFDEITFDLITKTVLKMIPAKQKDRVRWQLYRVRRYL